MLFVSGVIKCDREFCFNSMYVMKNQNQQQIIQTPFHELEEVLKDPNTKWSEIRSALRAHGRRSCTNAAVLCALSRCNNSIEKLSDHIMYILKLNPQCK